MGSFISEETIEKVRELSDIVQVIEEYLPLKKSGTNYVGLCPFHNEKTPSFTVSESKQFFKCFGCGVGGDAVAFIMRRENLSFPEAIRLLADKQGITVEENKLINKDEIEKKENQYKINKEAAMFFHGNLKNNRKALDYLYKRNISNKVITQFGLGYSLDSWHSLYNHLSSKGYLDSDMEKLGLIGKRSDGNGYYDRFRNRIIFPIIDTRSRVIGFGGRVLDDTMPKYLNSKETPIFNKGNHLYGLNLLSKVSNRKKILLVEGYMDVIALYKKGLNYGVASLGTAVTENQARLLKRYGKEVYICYDSDLAGINATNKAINILLKEGVDPKVVILQDYKDPDEFLKENGLKEFEERIGDALNHVDYRIYINKQKYNLNEAEGKIKFTMEMAKIIKDLKSPIEKDVYINKISNELKISKEAIEKEVFGRNVNKRYNNKTRNQFKGSGKDNRETILPIKTILPLATLTAEIDLIKLMIFDKEYYDLLIDEEAIKNLENLECREILNIMKELYKEEEILDEKLLYKMVREVDGIDMELVNTIEERSINFSPENIEQIMEDLIKTLNINKIESKRNLIKIKIEELEKKDTKDEIELANFANLCIELINLNKELNLIKHKDGR